MYPSRSCAHSWLSAWLQLFLASWHQPSGERQEHRDRRSEVTRTHLYSRPGGITEAEFALRSVSKYEFRLTVFWGRFIIQIPWMSWAVETDENHTDQYQADKNPKKKNTRQNWATILEPSNITRVRGHLRELYWSVQQHLLLRMMMVVPGNTNLTFTS